MTLAELHQLILDVTNYPAEKFAALVPVAVRHAALFLENNYTYRYMENILPITIQTGVRDYIVSGQKEIILLRIQKAAADGTFTYEDLTRIDPEQFDHTPLGQPEAYYETGTGFTINSVPDKDYLSQLFYSARTVWPASGTPTLLARYESLLFYQGIIQLALMARDPEMAASYQTVHDMALKSSIDEDTTSRQANRKEAMGFWGSHT